MPGTHPNQPPVSSQGFLEVIGPIKGCIKAEIRRMVYELDIILMQFLKKFSNTGIPAIYLRHLASYFN